jgi:hypothetical protein
MLLIKKLTVVFCCFSVSVMAQKQKINISIGAEGAIMATAQAFPIYNPAFGATVKMLYPFKKHDYFTAATGVLIFGGKSGTLAEIYTLLGQKPGFILQQAKYGLALPSLTIVPLKVGYKTKLYKKLFAEVETGYTFGFTKSFETGVDLTDEVSGVNFSGGFSFLVSKKIDIGLRYEQWNTIASNTNYTAFVALRTIIMLDF